MRTGQTRVILCPVNRDNWRAVVKLEVTQPQCAFVAAPSYYLALCCYGEAWKPLAICLGEKVIGFMMWAVDPGDGSCWLGGILIDKAHQRRGYGREAIQAVLGMLSKEHGCQNFALSYSPQNPAKQLYQALGFVETDEMEDDEVVARFSLE